MSDTVTLYGIPNCDTIKKARNWLKNQQIDYQFHDYRKQGIDGTLLQSMAAQLGWETMLNRRGTTWRAVPEAQKAQIDEASALQLMCENPAMIKRPILAHGNSMYIAFNEKQYQEIFKPA
jgi:Spx/MgsR family transcriptional regulator